MWLVGFQTAVLCDSVSCTLVCEGVRDYGIVELGGTLFARSEFG